MGTFICKGCGATYPISPEICGTCNYAILGVSISNTGVFAEIEVDTTQDPAYTQLKRIADILEHWSKANERTLFHRQQI